MFIFYIRILSQIYITALTKTALPGAGPGLVGAFNPLLPGRRSGSPYTDLLCQHTNITNITTQPHNTTTINVSSTREEPTSQQSTFGSSRTELGSELVGICCLKREMM